MNTKYDDEIREVEERLTRERQALAANAEDLSTTAREAAASPKGLLAALAVGFVLGEITSSKRRGRRKPDKSEALETTKKAGLGGLLLSGVLAFVRAQYGSPMALGRHAWDYYTATQRARRDAMARSTGYASPAASAVHPSAPVPPAPGSASAASSSYGPAGPAAPSSSGHAAG